MGIPRQSSYQPNLPPTYTGEWPALDDDFIKAMPRGILREVVRALGFGRAQRWLEQNGGVHFYLAKTYRDNNGLSPDEHQRLLVVLHDYVDDKGRITLPKMDKLFHRVRNEHIRKSKHRHSITAQAREYHLSSRQIVNIRRDAEDRNGDLFS